MLSVQLEEKNLNCRNLCEIIVKYCSCSRNRMPNYVVEADSINTFKNRLDKYWINEDVVFNCNSEQT